MTADREQTRRDAADEFERAYAARSGVTIGWLRAQGRVVVRCHCDDESCEGWASVARENAADYERGGIYYVESDES